jgi:hypothetical protein
MFRSPVLRSRLNLLLAVSLLVLGWFQLQHELTAHLEHPDPGCLVCVYTGHLGDGAAPATRLLLAIAIALLLFLTPAYSAPTLIQPFRHALSQRGPPAHSSLN